MIRWLRERFVFTILRDSVPIMRRYRLLDTRWGGVYLHHFLKSDADYDLHDHPWHFTSLILWGGYFEERFVHANRRDIIVTWHSPLSVVKHRATDAHRVELGKRTAWTLIWVSPRVRDWGFHTEHGWVPWQEYVKS